MRHKSTEFDDLQKFRKKNLLASLSMKFSLLFLLDDCPCVTFFLSPSFFSLYRLSFNAVSFRKYHPGLLAAEPKKPGEPLSKVLNLSNLSKSFPQISQQGFQTFSQTEPSIKSIFLRYTVENTCKDCILKYKDRQS